MSAMQKKILTAIKKAANDAGFECNRSSGWANTGKVYIQPENSFENVLNFCYNFQNDYCSLQFFPGDVTPQGTCGFTHRDALANYGYLRYSDSEQIKDMMSWIKSELRKRKD